MSLKGGHDLVLQDEMLLMVVTVRRNRESANVFVREVRKSLPISLHIASYHLAMAVWAFEWAVSFPVSYVDADEVSVAVKSVKELDGGHSCCPAQITYPG
jgi:hypothetical protein